MDAYSRGLRLKPSAPDGLSGLAQTYSTMGRTADAERLLKQVLSSNPRRGEDALLLGDLYMRSGDYTNALTWLGRAERIQPGARSELLLAISYQHLKQMDEARHYLELAKQRAPNNPEVQRSLAGYYRETGDYPQAIAALQSIRNPKPDVLAELAYTYQLDGKAEESARTYAQAANARPKDLGLQLATAQAEVAAGSIPRAQPFLQRAAGIDPNYYRLHAIRAEIAQMQEHDREAVREYNAALAHLPANPVEGPLYGIQLHMDLVNLYKSLNDADAAHQQLAIAQAEIRPLNEQGADRAQFLRLRADIKMNAGDLDGALNDMKEALAINDHDPSSLQLDGDLLMKLGRTEDAIAVYKRILSMDPVNRFALTSLGYASRAVGRDQDAEKYFQRLAKVDPSLYVPYLALGDLYTSRHKFKQAQAAYRKAYGLAPQNALIVAGAMNAAIEAQKLDVAAVWDRRATSEMQREPQILREEERYLRLNGQFQQSAEIGRRAIKVLPRDRDVVVYLGYDLLHLEQYDELLKLTSKYRDVFPKEPDIPLLAGYVHKHDGQMELARQDFTEALQRDPNAETAYVNLGYVLNDLHEPAAAAANFESAIKREPKDGEAHLGLAYSNLDLHKPAAALREVQLAQEEMGDSEPIHLIRATAYGREGMLSRAASEYRAALKFDPNDGGLYFGLGNTLFSERRYRQAISELEKAQKFSPNDPAVYALMARGYANLEDPEQTRRYVELAERHAEEMPVTSKNAKAVQVEKSGIYVSTGEALSTLGDQNAAMERFRKALTTPGSDRVGVRLAIAKVMAQQDHTEDATRQIALALMEAEAGETLPPTGQQYVEAADVFRGLHEYQLSQNYLVRARGVGASDASVRIGMAENYLAMGDTARAQGELSAIRNEAGGEPDYQYLLAKADVLRQEHRGAQALTAFAQAATAEGEDQTAEESLLQAGGSEGYRINSAVSVLSDFSIDPIFEDSTVYVLDSKLDIPGSPVPSSDVSLLPTPRSTLQTQETAAFHLHLGNLPTPAGFFQVRNARGQISVPAFSHVPPLQPIVNRNTTDYTMNFGLNPTIHLGSNVLTFDAGIQGTIRRDSESPREMNQNLFRMFTYMSTSSFFNAISVSGYVIREGGPFTESNLHSHNLTGAIDFRVGAPWGKTALVTGWGSHDQTFSNHVEDYSTSSYIGLEHRFSDSLDIRALVEDLRAWRVVGPYSGIAQDLHPAGSVNFALTRNWDLQASTSYSSTRSFHVYDSIQNGFSFSYVRPFHRKFNAETGEVTLQYPIRFSAGMQEQTFFNFTGGHNQQFRPYVSITLF